MGVASIPVLPRRLSSGDTVAVIAPSSPFDREKFQKGVAVLSEIGLCPLWKDDIFASQGYLAGSDDHRARLLHDCFADPGVKGIFCARGGYGALRLLERLDWEIVAANPKVFVGYSDVSVLLNVFYARCGFVTFHGPMMASLGEATPPTRLALMEALFSDAPLTVIARKQATLWSGRSEGIVSGGNLATLCHLLGTPYQPDFEGHILFLEDIGEPPYRIDRMLTQMRLAGCFQGVTGLALGSFKDCGPLERIYRLVEDIFADFSIPVLAGFDAGHGEPNLVIPFGIRATLDADGGRLIYMESAVAP